MCVGTRSEGDFELLRSVKCASLLLEVCFFCGGGERDGEGMI